MSEAADTLATKLDQIEKLEKAAAMDIEAVPIKVRPGHEMAKRQAVEGLETAKEEYGEIFRKSAMCIFLAGSPEGQAKFAALAEQYADAYIVDAEKMYKNMAKNVWCLVGKNNTWTISNTPEAIQALKNEMDGCDIDSCPMFDLNYDMVLTGGEPQLAQEFKNAIRKTSEDALNKAFIERDLVQAAIAAGDASKAVGVVVMGTVLEEAKSLAKSLCAGEARNVIVDVPDQIDRESVIKALIAAKKSIK